LARVLGVEIPKVAALFAIELVKPAKSSTCEAACLSKMAQRKQISNAIVDGPLAFDNAIFDRNSTGTRRLLCMTQYNAKIPFPVLFPTQ